MKISEEEYKNLLKENMLAKTVLNMLMEKIDYQAYGFTFKNEEEVIKFLMWVDQDFNFVANRAKDKFERELENAKHD